MTEITSGAVEVKTSEMEEIQSCRRSKMSDTDARLCDEFLQEYERFAEEFDRLSQDAFAGERLDQISQDALARSSQHECFHRVPYSIGGARFPNCNNNEALNEDLKIVTGEIQPDKATRWMKTLAQLYRRACQGNYLLITLKKSRQNRESDRWRPVDFGRHAIRYDSACFETSYWYMIGKSYAG